MKSEVKKSIKSQKLKVKKKRAKSRSTPSRPQRALSAYNLFYRYKRIKILEAQINGDVKESKETIQRLIATVPGLEQDSIHSLDLVAVEELPQERMNEICRTEIRNTLKDNMAPNDDSKRLHRKSQNGCLSFVEMGKLMAASWKAIDSFSKSVFQELAQEGRIIHKELVAEYEKVHGSPPATKRRATTKSAKNSKRPPSQEYVR